MAALPAWAARLNPLRRPTFLERVFRPAMEAAPLLLTQRRLYILPTRHGLVYALMLLVMLLGAINYGNSMAFVLTFLLGGLGVVSILHTYRNLARLTVNIGKSAPVFVGQDARFQICLENPGTLSRYAIGLRADSRAEEEDPNSLTDIEAGKSACLEFTLPAKKRGLLQAGRFTLYSSFPLGLFRTWTHLHLDLSCLVYPHPAAEDLPLPKSETDAGDGAQQGEGHDDFSGLRTYHNGDSLRHVAWKAVAREQGMLTKQFTGESQQETWLDWEMLGGMESEARLSRLTRWVLDADAASERYGLRLPGRTLAPATGPEHRRQCLEALALFGIGNR